MADMDEVISESFHVSFTQNELLTSSKDGGSLGCQSAEHTLGRDDSATRERAEFVWRKGGVLNVERETRKPDR